MTLLTNVTLCTNLCGLKHLSLGCTEVELMVLGIQPNELDYLLRRNLHYLQLSGYLQPQKARFHKREAQ